MKSSSLTRRAVFRTLALAGGAALLAVSRHGSATQAQATPKVESPQSHRVLRHEREADRF